MRIHWALAGAALLVRAAAAQPAAIQDLSHASQALGEMRSYRVFLPPGYADSQKRYPVVYWFHGFGERFNRSTVDYDVKGNGGDTIANYVAAHDVIVVKPDGWNPRRAGEDYARPWNVGPVETSRQFALYFPELVERIDSTLRTVPDRAHRAVTGYSMGGFMSFWIAGKYPDLVGSASAFMPSPEFLAGPEGFEAEYNLEDFYGNYDGVRTRLVTGKRDFLRFYHRRLNALWSYTRTDHETEEFDSEHGTPGIARTLDFHMRAFAAPLPPPAVFNHADLYPDFTVWGWDVASDRRQPGFTTLENVSKAGFRSSVREWIPGGAVIASAKLSIASPPLYRPGSAQTVTYIRLRDGKVRRGTQKADARGRLTFELDGEPCEIGISAAPVLAVTGYDVEGAEWASAGQPVRIRVRFVNKGGDRLATSSIKWESPNPGVSIEPAAARLYGLARGESATLPLTFTVQDSQRPMVRIQAVQGETRLAFDVPLFPPAEPAKDFLISDGHTVNLLQHGAERAEVTLGEGNHDGQAAPGESFALLLPDGAGGWMRAAELFTNDSCVDTSVRLSDSWAAYDHAGASAKYTLAAVRADCEPGHVVRALARVLLPNAPEHRLLYRTVEFPVWYRTAGAAKP